MTPRRNIIPVFVPHLGCPNDCVFCNQKKISGEEKPASKETVIDIIEKAKSIIPPGKQAELAFYGGSFTAIPFTQRIELLETAYSYVEEGFLSGLRISTRPDAIDEAGLMLLRQYSVKTIELGAQSMDAAVLALSGRGHTPEDTVNAAKMIKSQGFKLILQMMTGLPGDTFESSVNTAKKLAELKPDGVRIYPTVIIKDTRLYDMWINGEYIEHSIEDAAVLCAELFLLFEKENIPIIRMGLNPTDELSGGNVAGGAYHPAFGELVKSKVIYNRARKLLDSSMHGKDIQLGVNSSCVSSMTGQKRCNVNALCEEFGLRSLKIKPTDTERGSVVLLNI